MRNNKSEWNPEGHVNTNKGPHVMEKEWRPAMKSQA